MLDRIKRLFIEDVVDEQPPAHARSIGGGMSFFGGGAGIGVSVGSSSSLAFSAVYACVNLISNDLATLPISVYKETGKGNERQPQHDQAYLIRKKPHQLYNSVVYRRTMFSNLLLWGNAYAKIHRNGGGRPTSYEMLKPWEVEPYVAITSQGREKYFKHYKDGEIIADMDMIHLADLSHDGIKGLSKISLAKTTISLGLNAAEFGDSYYKKGAFMSGYLKLKKRLTDIGRKNLQEDFITQYAGRDNAGSVGILEEDTEFVPYDMAMPMTDAQFLESRKFQVEEIARFFNTPPHKIGDLSKSSFSNIEQQNVEYVVNTLSPIAKLWEIEHDIKIFSPNEIGDHFVRIELKGLLRGDIKTRSAFYRGLMDRGVFSPNEVRGLEDMPAYEGGDVRILPLNFVPVEDFGKVEKSELKKGKKKKKS